MADNELNVSVIVDTSGLDTGTAKTSAAVNDMAARIKAAFGSVEKAPEGVQNALKVMENSATQSAEVVAASAAAIEQALNKITPAASTAGSAIDRAMTTAAARILVTEAGLGRMGLALTRVGIASGALGPLLELAFPILLVTAFVSIIDRVIDKIQEMRDRALNMDLAWQGIDHTIISFGDHLNKQLEDTDTEITKLTDGPLAAFQQRIKDSTVDTDALFNHIRSVMQEFTAEAKKNDRGILMQFITGRAGVGEVITEAKRAQDAIEQALNKGDIDAAVRATGSALTDIIVREKELKSVSGAEDRIKAYEQLDDILSRYNVDLARSVELAKDRGDLAGAKSAAEAMKEFDRGAKEDARKSAEEELELFDRNLRLEKEGEEELKKFTEEKARIELELLDRRLAAEKKLMEEEKKINDDLLHSALTTAKAEMDAADSRFEHEFKMGAITEQHLTELKKKALDQEFAAEQAALQRRLGLIAANDPDNPAQRQKIYDQLLALQQKYALQSQKINQTMLEQQKQELAKMTTAFNQNFVQWVNGSESFAKAMMKTWQGMADTFITSLLKMAEQMVVNAALQKSIAAGTKLDDAKTAAANTYAQVSAIPLIGWLLAPPAAAAAFAAVLAFEKGGFVPGATGSPVPIIAHAGEAVLPEPIARGLRSAFSGGGSSTQNFGGSTVHNHISIDARGAASKDEILELVQSRLGPWLYRMTRSSRELGE